MAFANPPTPTPPSYDVARLRTTTTQTLVDFALAYRSQLAYRVAVAGNGLGTLDVAGANRRIYVELGASGGDVAEASYDQFKPALGDAVFLQRVRVMGLGGWIVIGFVKGVTAPCAS